MLIKNFSMVVNKMLSIEIRVVLSKFIRNVWL